MARLDPKERAELPDRCFADIDSRGRRRLPLHDPAHVRNALARFGQVRFEDDAERERARMRLLKAAKKFRIVPVGFIAGQLPSEREHHHRPAALPSGFVTMLMTDIESSTALVHRLGDGYRHVISTVCAVQREAVGRVGGCEVEARADEFFAVFEDPRSAVDATIAMQRDLRDLRDLREHAWGDGVDVRIRIGIHSGYPTSTDDNYIGLDVHVTSRICAVGHGGQIVVSYNTREAVKASPGGAGGLRFTSLGAHRLRGTRTRLPCSESVPPDSPHGSRHCGRDPRARRRPCGRSAHRRHGHSTPSVGGLNDGVLAQRPAVRIGAHVDGVRVARHLIGANHVVLAARDHLRERPRVARVAQAITQRMDSVDVEPGRVGLRVPQREQTATQTRLAHQVGAAEAELDVRDADHLDPTLGDDRCREITVEHHRHRVLRTRGGWSGEAADESVPDEWEPVVSRRLDTYSIARPEHHRPAASASTASLSCGQSTSAWAAQSSNNRSVNATQPTLRPPAGPRSTHRKVPAPPK